jgi:hypothetical protein
MVKIVRNAFSFVEDHGADIGERVFVEGIGTPSYLAAAVVDHAGGVYDQEVVIVVCDVLIRTVDCVEVPFVLEQGCVESLEFV